MYKLRLYNQKNFFALIYNFAFFKRFKIMFQLLLFHKIDKKILSFFLSLAARIPMHRYEAF